MKPIALTYCLLYKQITKNNYSQLSNFITMKNLKIFLFILIASTLSLPSFASAVGVKPKSDLRTELVNYLDSPSLTVFDSDEMFTNILFMVNNENEIILVDTGTKNNRLDNYLKAKLNYRKVSSVDVEYYKLYSVKVIFKSKKI